jgi:Asp-tRNA(Asn)/Glu-tRNA(Gln) amidotransferase A subunit family amidase
MKTTDLSRRQFIGGAAAAASISLLPDSAFAQHIFGATAERLIMPQDPMDRDLLEVTIPKLHALYESRKYTTTQVTRWYLSRIARYDRVYRSMIHVDTAGALAAAAALDAAAAKSGRELKRGPLWGVPIVIKANTSVKGLVTSAGWYGYLVPGHELIAPRDATVVEKLKAAGAIILGQTNMPDFAASDANFSTAFGRTGNAYDVRFSPGGSSGGTVTAVTANFCVLGTGTDTGNSIRMPAGTSSVVGVLPTRGLTSIAGIHPLNWLLDNTGPIARSVTDAAIALDVMAGEDAKDFRTRDAATRAQSGPYTKYLNVGSLKDKRFGVPSFIVQGANEVAPGPNSIGLRPETRALFLKAIEGLRAAGATVVVDDGILPSGFLELIGAVKTQQYGWEGTETFLRDYGPAEYHSAAEYARAVGTPLPAFVRGTSGNGGPPPMRVESDPQSEQSLWGPQRQALAAYDDAFDRFHLDGLVYPSAQMPPNDEMIPLAEGRRSDGPHSNTSWVNVIGVPAIVVPGGFYANGLPFGLELSAKRWRDGDLLGWSFAYEQATKFRKPPELVDKR